MFNAKNELNDVKSSQKSPLDSTHQLGVSLRETKQSLNNLNAFDFNLEFDEFKVNGIANHIGSSDLCIENQSTKHQHEVSI